MAQEPLRPPRQSSPPRLLIYAAWGQKESPHLAVLIELNAAMSVAAEAMTREFERLGRVLGQVGK